jgi:hypothetical protein
LIVKGEKGGYESDKSRDEKEIKWFKGNRIEERIYGGLQSEVVGCKERE